MINVENIRVLVLASILSANEYGAINLDVVFTTGISKDWFEDEGQKVVFDIMNICYKGSIAFDESTMIAHLQKASVPNPEQIILNILTQKQIPQNILLEHINYLKELYHKKMLYILNGEISKMLQDENLSSSAISQMIQNSIDDNSTLTKGSSTKRLSEVRAMRKTQPPAERIKTGIGFIDTVLTDKHGNKGIRNEGLVFVSGKKQSGKTFILTRLIENVSKQHPVMFGSMEFGQDLYDENVEDMQEDNLFDGNIENIFTFDDIYETDAIIAEIKLQHKLYGIKIVVLDSMMRMTNNNPDLKTDERRISEMFSKFGKLSKELKIPIIIVVQSSKEDLKSSIISVKGSMNADHEAYVWFHLAKSKPKETDDEMRTVIWNKNKDTHKHPVQNLMFVPQTSDFYRVEIDEHGNAGKALDKYRKPLAKGVETAYEEIPKAKSKSKQDTLAMPVF